MAETDTAPESTDPFKVLGYGAGRATRLFADALREKDEEIQRLQHDGADITTRTDIIDWRNFATSIAEHVQDALVAWNGYLLWGDELHSVAGNEGDVFTGTRSRAVTQGLGNAAEAADALFHELQAQQVRLLRREARR